MITVWFTSQQVRCFLSDSYKTLYS